MPRAITPPAEISLALVPLAHAPARAAALFDLDGTLAPIVERPDAAAVPARTRELVARIADRFALAAVISGRRAADARRILGLEEVAYVGNHGFEVLAPGAGEVVPAPELAGHEEDAARFLAGLAPGALENGGLRVEDKGAIRALHWRGAAEEEAAGAQAEAIAARAEAAGLLTHRGRKVLELRPPVRLDKGNAVRALLARTNVEAALYAGDDRTDLDAFAALRALREAGQLETVLAVAVLAEETPLEVAELADLAVAGPEGFITVLEALA